MLLFNVKSSKKIGFGHLSRSLKLASLFRKKNVSFLINNDASSIKILKTNNYKNIYILKKSYHQLEKILLKNKIKVFINDTLKSNANLFRFLFKKKIRIVNFDDTSKASKIANVNIYPTSFYKKNHKKNFYFGPEYIPLGKIKIKRRLRKKINSILVVMGGSDTYNLSEKLIKKILPLKKKISVIEGALKVKKINKIYNKKINIISKPKNIFEQYQRFDLLICGGGIIPFEAAAVGLPSLIISCEEHEKIVGKILHNLGCSIYLGHKNKIKNFLTNISDLNIKKMSTNCIRKINLDGNKKIKKIILQQIFLKTIHA
jgi:spore coat polysaccharide biosynthesis predicted glycosyltransferase SpsG